MCENYNFKIDMKITTKVKIFEIVNRIPTGKVAFYGQIANIATSEGFPITAQVVGWILSGIKEKEFDQLAWHRVVAKNGFVASLKLGVKGLLQIALLEQENIEIVSDIIDMSKFGVKIEELLLNS